MLPSLLSFDAYDAALLLLGVGAFGMVLLPRFLASRIVSYPIVYVAAGVLLGALPLPIPAVDPVAHPDVAERLAELTVIVSLTGVGLKLERPFAVAQWPETWRLLAIAMPLTVAAVALLGLWAGLPLAAALLAGAVLAPTDPVLASDVQTAGPNEVAGEDEEEDRVRFALTSEAGLNDGLGFPFTHLALGTLGAGSLVGTWLVEWVLVAVVLKVALGVLVGWLAGRLIGWVVFTRTIGDLEIARTAEGLISLAITLLAYGAAELAQGYGFVAVFVAALTVRQFEREHDYHSVLHQFADQTERLLVAVVLVLLGAAVADGVLAGLSWPLAIVAVAAVLVVRPVAGTVSFLGSGLDPHETRIVSFFGIRGVGSVYYLAYAATAADDLGGLPEEDALWAFVALAILVSVVVHGLTATRVMQRFDRVRVGR